MLTRHTLWRIVITSRPLQALAIGLLATGVAALLWLAAPATNAALEWSVYDRWLSHRPPIALSSSLTIIAPDPERVDQEGLVSLDRAQLAQLITAAHDSGAIAIGLAHRLSHASPSQLGGAASDVLFSEALATAGPVVTVASDDMPETPESAALGHLHLQLHPDHVARLIPLSVTQGTRTVPAFGSRLYALATHQPLTVAPDDTRLINPVGDGSFAAFQTLSWSAVWDAFQRQDATALARWFNGKVVVILPSRPSDEPWLLPTGARVSSTTAHLHLLNSLLTEAHFCPVGNGTAAVITVAMSTLLAFSLLSFRGLRGLLSAAGVIVLAHAATWAALIGFHLVLPVALPFLASFLVVLGTTAWTHLTAGQRLLLLEQDMLRIQQDAAAVREALIVRENRADALEEDLEAARDAAARTTDRHQALTQTAEALRAELTDVQAQEQEARRQLAMLEQHLHDLRAASTEPRPLDDTTLDRLREDCAQVGIITRDPTLLRLFRDVKKGAKTPLTVLLLGEPGTGKELVARAVHRLSPRAGAPFIAVNMAAMSPELVESELFGHIKGSFTGATTDRRGYFELANHGTIFLDEIGDLRLDHQSKLLRVLQEKSFYRVGATTPTTVDVRIVAATNRDLQRGVSEGWFREDLYFRLKGLVFTLPPLRERPGDITLIAEASLTDIARQLGRSVPTLSNDAVRVLREHAWPGNVRELRHALERAVALSDGPILTKASFELDGGQSRTDRDRTTPALLPDSASDAAVLECLRRHGFDMQATANTLGWDRGTVTQRLKGLCFHALVESQGSQPQAALAIAGDPSHLRTVELKLLDYYGHLRSVIEPFTQADEAVAACKRRFKNLPERHFKAVEILVRRHLH